LATAQPGGYRGRPLRDCADPHAHSHPDPDPYPHRDPARHGHPDCHAYPNPRRSLTHPHPSSTHPDTHAWPKRHACPPYQHAAARGAYQHAATRAYANIPAAPQQHARRDCDRHPACRWHALSGPVSQPERPPPPGGRSLIPRRPGMVYTLAP